MAVSTDRIGLSKTLTGIAGFDDITYGGLPKDRTSVIIGGAGSGKTMFAMEFLSHGASMFNEPGVFISFEETPEDLVTNFASLGYDLKEFEDKRQLIIDYIYIERSEIEETGEYDLEALFIRIGSAIDSIGAKRVVIDSVEVLFSGLSNKAILRAELRRLFRFLKRKGVTVLVTGERDAEEITSYKLEEYVADCVILLDNRMQGKIATRRLRISKYRGSLHETNEFPFIITDTGILVLPITSIGLAHEVSNKRVSTGVAGLDEMMGGKGYYRATSILVTGTAGTGKTSFAASFVASACQRGEKCLYFAFEESPKQILRNMKSIGIDLEPFQSSKLLTFHAIRSTQLGLENHLATMIKRIKDTKPSIVVVDPMSNLIGEKGNNDGKEMLTRLVDYLKSNAITSIFTFLTGGESYHDDKDSGISSIMDTWISIKNCELNGERNRGLYVLKSRGIAHTNRVLEFVMTDHGIGLVPAYFGPDGMIAGTAREIQMVRDREAALAMEQEKADSLCSLELKRKLLKARIELMQLEFSVEEMEIQRNIALADSSQTSMAQKQE